MRYLKGSKEDVNGVWGKGQSYTVAENLTRLWLLEIWKTEER